MKQFSQNILQAIEVALHEEKKTNPYPVAAFDADGTLWCHDMGEGLFRYQIAKGLVKKNLDGIEDPWQHYRDWKNRGGVNDALMWLAQINRGFRIETVREWALDYVKSISPMSIFPEQRELIRWLRTRGVRIFVVTASCKWSVEPAAAFFEIPFGDVLGLRTRIQDGWVTDIPEGFLTYREGKAGGLLEATGGVRPFLASGNSMGDEFLLACSSQIRLAVRSHPPEHELFETEQELETLARKNKWLTHTFPFHHSKQA